MDGGQYSGGRMKMVFNRVLLEKEYYHNRGYYLVSVLLFIFGPVVTTLIAWLAGSLSSRAYFLYHMLHFGSAQPAGPVSYGGTGMTLFWITSILLGSLLLGEERKGSLSYLVSTPVSRREIMVAKFVAGAGVIIFAMGINSLFLAGLGMIHPMPYTGQDVLDWALLLTSACLAFFSLALMVSTFTAGILSAGMVTFLLSYLPRTVMSMADFIAARYFGISESVSINLHYLGSYFSIGDYISRSDRARITSLSHSPDWRFTGISSSGTLPPDYMLESLFLLLAVNIFLFLAVKIFERSHLESAGSVFASGIARRLCWAIIIILFCYLMVFSHTDTLLRFVLYMVLLCVASYKAIKLVYRRLYGRPL